MPKLAFEKNILQDFWTSARGEWVKIFLACLNFVGFLPECTISLRFAQTYSALWQAALDI